MSAQTVTSFRFVFPLTQTALPFQSFVPTSTVRSKGLDRTSISKRLLLHLMSKLYLLKLMQRLAHSIKSKFLIELLTPCFLNDSRKPFTWHVAGILERVSFGLVLPLNSDSSRINRESAPFGPHPRLKWFSHKSVLFP